MDLLSHRLLNKAKATQIVEKLLSEKAVWQDGKQTAGSHAAKVKNNLQLSRSSNLSNDLCESIISSMLNDSLLKSYSLPRKIHGLVFSRTASGQGYGTHVDNPYMSSGRSDLSFTLFLNNPEEYEGGELCIQTMQDTQEIKLGSGEVIIYPSTTLHSVNTVKSGERIVCVGWIQSYVASHEEREMLFAIDAGAKGLLGKHGRSPELDLIFQSYGNLLRRLGD